MTVVKFILKVNMKGKVEPEDLPYLAKWIVETLTDCAEHDLDVKGFSVLNENGKKFPKVETNDHFEGCE